MRTVGREGGWAGIATNYALQGTGGTTLLRVVSSGFGPGEEWDDLLDGFGHGWDFELRGLRHYLERHPGEDRAVAFVRAPYAGSKSEAWKTLTGPGSWFGTDGLDRLAVGERFAVRTVTGDAFCGVVELWQPPTQFVGAVEGWNRALLRVELFGSRATIWLSTHGAPKADVGGLQDRWRGSAAELFVTAT